MTKLNENVGSVEYDELINSAEPKADVFNVTLRAQAAETILKRGTVLALSDADNKVVVLGTSAKTFGEGASTKTENLTANCILSDDVTVGTKDCIVVAYRTGHFNRNKLIVAEGYTLTHSDEEELRKVGILLDTALNA